MIDATMVILYCQQADIEATHFQGQDGNICGWGKIASTPLLCGINIYNRHLRMHISTALKSLWKNLTHSCDQIIHGQHAQSISF